MVGSPIEGIGELLSVEPAGPRDSARLPAVGGAYVLAILLDKPAIIANRGARLDFAPGWYAYVGSANGPGGLRARLGRHLRKDKRVHWHVDPLTMAAARLVGFALTGETECALGTRLADSGVFSHVIPGFGSSDCRACTSHLLRWNEA